MPNSTGYSDYQLYRMQQEATADARATSLRASPETGDDNLTSDTPDIPEASAAENRIRLPLGIGGENGFKLPLGIGSEGGLKLPLGIGSEGGFKLPSDLKIPDSLKNLFSDFTLDTETIFLLGLAYMLYEKGGNMKLILAILYIVI